MLDLVLSIDGQMGVRERQTFCASYKHLASVSYLLSNYVHSWSMLPQNSDGACCFILQTKIHPQRIEPKLKLIFALSAVGQYFFSKPSYHSFNLLRLVKRWFQLSVPIYLLFHSSTPVLWPLPAPMPIITPPNNCHSISCKPPDLPGPWHQDFQRMHADASPLRWSLLTCDKSRTAQNPLHTFKAREASACDEQAGAVVKVIALLD